MPALRLNAPPTSSSVDALDAPARYAELLSQSLIDAVGSLHPARGAALSAIQQQRCLDPRNVASCELCRQHMSRDVGAPAVITAHPRHGELRTDARAPAIPRGRRRLGPQGPK